jgi:hypothetical protein
MHVLTAVPQVLALVVAHADQAPKPEDVKAGWLAFGIFIALILAVAFLGWSLVKQLRKVDAAEDAGLYDPSDRKPVRQLPVDQGPSAAPPVDPEGDDA